jgi:hypothetical protein
LVARTFNPLLVPARPLPDDEVIGAIVGIYRGTVYGFRP